jgi:hypothetical protein
VSAALVLLPGELTISIRPATDADRPCILSSWSRGLYHWTRHVLGGEREVSSPALNAHCERLLARYGAVVAVNPALDSQLLGWACLDPSRNLAHYVYVLEPFRRQRVASALCAPLGLPITATHWTLDCETLPRRLGLCYRPSLAH